MVYVRVATSLPRGLCSVARTWVVSWLRAASLAFPTIPVSGIMSVALSPVTVAGPHRHCTGFRVPRSQSLVAPNLGAATLRGKRLGQFRLELGPTRFVRRRRVLILDRTSLELA